MMKKLMSLGLVGILSASLMVGCSSNDSKDDDTVTIKYVDENGNVKKETVTKDEAKQIENNQKQQSNDTTKNNNATKKETTKDNSNKDDQDDMTEDEMYEKGLIKKHGGHLEEEAKKQESIHEDDDNYDKELYGNAVLDTCPDCGRNGMVFNNGNGLKCAYCGFYDPNYYLPEESDQGTSDDNKDDESQDYDDYEYENDNDVEESPSETIENN